MNKKIKIGYTIIALMLLFLRIDLMDFNDLSLANNWKNYLIITTIIVLLVYTYSNRVGEQNELE